MMYHKMQTISINLLGIMLAQMREATKRLKVSLPCDMLLPIFLRHLEYHLRGSPQKNTRAMMSTMTKSSIRWDTGG